MNGQHDADPTPGHEQADERADTRVSGRPRRRRRWLRWVLAFLVLALIGAAVWLLGFSSVLATRQVNVAGVSVLNAAQVRAAAAVPLGLPLARQDLDAVAARVATLVPVESVTVDRTWPDAVDIRITERTPVLALRDIGGFNLVDRAGVAFDQVPQRPPGVVLAEADRSNRALLVSIGVVAQALPEELRTKVSQYSRHHPESTDRDSVVRTDDQLGYRRPVRPQGPDRGRTAAPQAPRRRRVLTPQSRHSLTGETLR